MVRSTRITRRHNRSHKRSTTLHRRRYGKGRRRARSGRARVVTRKGRVRRRWMRGGRTDITRPSFEPGDVSAREEIATTLYDNPNFKVTLGIVPFANSNSNKRVIVYGTLHKIDGLQKLGLFSKRWLQIYDATEAAAAAAAAATYSRRRRYLPAAAAAEVPSAPDPEELSSNDSGAGEEETDISDSPNAAAAAPPKVFVLVYSKNKNMTGPKVIFLDHIKTVDIIDDAGVSLTNEDDGTPYGKKRPILVLTYKEQFEKMSPTGNKVIKFTGNSDDEYVRKWHYIAKDNPNFRLFDGHDGDEREDIGEWVNSTEPNNIYFKYFNKESRRNGNRFIDEWFKALTLHVRRPPPPP